MPSIRAKMEDVNVIAAQETVTTIMEIDVVTVVIEVGLRVRLVKAQAMFLVS